MLLLIGAVMYYQVLERFQSLYGSFATSSNDLRIYHSTGEALLQGELPYRDFFIEYPPGGLPFFLPPALFTDGMEGFAAFFAAEMALLLVAALVFVALAARVMSQAWVVPALVLAGAVVLLYPVAVSRYDPVVSLTLAAAVLCAATGRHTLGHGALALGAAAKLVPALATLPLVLVAMGRASGGVPGKLRVAVRGYAVFFAGLALFFVPAAVLGWERFVESFTYHTDRGLQLESLAASVLLKLGWVEDVSFDYGALEVQGRGVELLGSLSLPVTAALLSVTALVALRELRLGRLGRADFPRFAAAFVLAFMLGSKVLSPQYMLWLLPLIPLAVRGVPGLAVSGVFLAACWTTTQVFPLNYSELIRVETGAVDLLLLRNLLLVLLWVLVLVLPANAPEDARRREPA